MCTQSRLTLCDQAPLSMGFSRQEYCSELPFPLPEDLPDPRIEPASPVSPWTLYFRVVAMQLPVLSMETLLRIIRLLFTLW